MEFLLNRYRNLTVLLLVIVGQLLLLAYQVRTNQDVRLIRVWAVTAVTPLARIIEVFRRNTVGFVEDYFVLLEIREKNRQLSADIGKLKLENQFLYEELQTADRARALAAFTARSQSQTIAARIIGTGPGANSRVVFVDRGSAAGVQKGMAVITPDGIVGKVVASYPTASLVQLITDSNFAAGVISDKNRVHGTLKGEGHSTCIVDYVQNEEKVEVGEKFYTSGDDRVFPKGMPVGTVTVVRSGKAFNKEIFVAPSGFQEGLEEVLIVLEGVHQPIPDPQMASTQPVHLQSAPPVDPNAQAGMEHTGTLETDADRLREKYKRIGEAQHMTYGEPTSGRSPNFNLDPGQAPKPGPSTQAPQPGANPTVVPPVQAAVKPGTTLALPAGGTPPSGVLMLKPKPPATTGQPASTPVPAPRPGQSPPPTAGAVEHSIPKLVVQPRIIDPKVVDSRSEAPVVPARKPVPKKQDPTPNP